MAKPTSLPRRRVGTGTTWERLCAGAARFPGVAQGTSYRTPALFFRKKLLARLKEDGDTVAIGVDFLDRDFLLEADPRAFFLTDHYRAYPWILMRMTWVRQEVAMKLLEDAWRRAAPSRVVAGYGTGEPRSRVTGRTRARLGDGRRRPTIGMVGSGTGAVRSSRADVTRAVRMR
jgi:hypothetical protein